MPVNRLRSVPRALLLAATALVGAGCVDFGLPADCDEPRVMRDVTVTQDTMSPTSIEACRDQQMELVIGAETDGVFHIHGYDEDVPATTIAAGEMLTLQFVAGRSGQFPIELHPADDPTGVSIGILTVHEP